MSLAATASLRVLALLAIGLALSGCRGQETADASDPALDALARCLAERGAVYYGASGCKACREQEALFGAPFAAIPQVECHPHAAGSEAERCLARGIRVTPTWLLEAPDREPRRLEGAHALAELARFAGCPEPAASGAPH